MPGDFYFFSYYSGPRKTPCSISAFLPEPYQYVLPSILLPYKFGLFSDFYLYNVAFPTCLISFLRIQIVYYTSELHTI